MKYINFIDAKRGWLHVACSVARVRHRASRRPVRLGSGLVRHMSCTCSRSPVAVPSGVGTRADAAPCAIGDLLWVRTYFEF